MNYRQGITPISGHKYAAGIAYIAIPTDIERSEYIADCCKNCYVSMVMDDGSFENRVYVGPEIFNYLEFPDKPEELGSPVVYVTDSIRKKPIIVARLNKSQELGDLKENQFKIRRMFNGAFVEITGSPIDRSLSITVDGNKSAGKLYLNVYNESDDGELNISVQGNIKIAATGDTVIEQEGIQTIRTVNESGEELVNFIQSNEGHTLKTPKIKVNDGNENYVLGQKLKSFLTDLITEISKSTVTTALGQMPLLNAAQIALFTKRIDETLSSVMYIDK